MIAAHFATAPQNVSVRFATVGVMQRNRESTQLRRQWALLRLLSASGRWFGVKELAEQMGCSKPTIERDLATLEAVFPLAEEQVGQQKKRYRIDLQIRVLEAIQPFGVMQLCALGAALQALHPLAGTALYDDLVGVAQLVRGALAERHNGGLDRMATVFLPHARGYVEYAAHADTIDELVDAIAQRQECRTRYRRAGDSAISERIVHPLKLLWHDGALYVMCRFANRGSVGKLAVHRIVEVERTGSAYPAVRADLAQVTSRAFGIYDDDSDPVEVDIHFSPAVAWLVAERVFHPSEVKTPLPDGGVRYRVRTTAKQEILRWVLQFQGEATLVGPTAWRTELAQQAAVTVERHTDGRTATTPALGEKRWA